MLARNSLLARVGGLRGLLGRTQLQFARPEGGLGRDPLADLPLQRRRPAAGGLARRTAAEKRVTRTRPTASDIRGMETLSR